MQVSIVILLQDFYIINKLGPVSPSGPWYPGSPGDPGSGFVQSGPGSPGGPILP